MKPVSTGSALLIAGLISLTCGGCQETPTAKEISASLQAASSANKITIDELLAREDLNEYASGSFERSKNMGQTEVLREVAESIIKTSYRKKAVDVAPKTRLKTRPVPQSTLARNDAPDRDTEDELTPLSARDRLELKHKYHELGVDHFEQRFIHGLPDDIRSEAADWMRRFIRQLPHTDCHHLKAILAAKAENYEVSEATFEELGDKFSTEAIRKLVYGGTSFNAMRSSVNAFNSEYHADAQELKRLWGNSYQQRHKNADKILALTDGMAEWVSTHSGGHYFKSAREILLAELAFKEEPVPLMFDEDFILWDSDDFSQFECVSPKTKRINNCRNNSKFRLRTRMRLMAQRIFECDVKFLDLEPDSSDPSSGAVDQQPSGSASQTDLTKNPGNAFRPSVAVGLIGRQYLSVGIGRAKETSRNSWHPSFNGVLTFGPSYSRGNLIEYKVNIKPDQNRLKIFFGVGYIEVYLNNQFVFRSYSRRFDWCHRVVLEQPSAAQGRGVVEFSNLTIREWKQGPPPTRSRDTAALIEYYEAAAEDAN